MITGCASKFCISGDEIIDTHTFFLVQVFAPYTLASRLFTICHDCSPRAIAPREARRRSPYHGHSCVSSTAWLHSILRRPGCSHFPVFARLGLPNLTLYIAPRREPIIGVPSWIEMHGIVRQPRDEKTNLAMRRRRSIWCYVRATDQTRR
jgi:hypothetical protein